MTSIKLPFYGRSDKNRTCDLLNPIQARYQTALHPDCPPILAQEKGNVKEKRAVFRFFLRF